MADDSFILYLFRTGSNVSNVIKTGIDQPGGRGRPYLVKYPEGLTDLLLAVCVFHFSRHHGEELGEINCSIP